MKLSEKIKFIRKSANYTQVAFAKLLNSSEISIRNYEAGRKKNPNGAFLIRLCKKFPNYAFWLMTGKDKAPKFLDKKLLKKIIIRLERSLIKNKIQINSTNKAKLIIKFYEYFENKEEPSQKEIDKVLKIAI